MDMAKLNGKTSRSLSRVSQTAGSSLVADRESAGTPANVGSNISQFMQNWAIHGFEMKPYYETVKRFITQKKLPICRNLSAKMKTVRTKKGEELVVQDPYSYADGTKKADDWAIETWALYAWADAKDRKFTWAHMEGARKAGWHFIKDWISPYKQPTTKRQIIFGACYLLLVDIEDGLDKLKKGFSMYDALDKVVRPTWTPKIDTTKVNPWTGKPYEEDEKELNNYREEDLGEWNTPVVPENVIPAKEDRSKWVIPNSVSQKNAASIKKKLVRGEKLTVELKRTPDVVEFPLKKTEPVKAMFLKDKYTQQIVNSIPVVAEESQLSSPLALTPRFVTINFPKMQIATSSEVELPVAQAATFCFPINDAPPSEEFELMEVDSVEDSTSFDEVFDAPDAVLPHECPELEDVEIDIDGDEDQATKEILFAGKKTRETSEFDIVFGHYNKLRSEAVEEIRKILVAADPYGVTCKCWQCIEQFLRRNPLYLHNQYKVGEEECELPPLKQKPYPQRVRDAHRLRCIDVRVNNLPEYQMCMHEFVDWSGDGAEVDDVQMTCSEIESYLLDTEIPFDNDDDYAKAFGDSEQPLETQENISKSQNITFVDERPIDEVNTYLGSSVATKDINNDIAEDPWNLMQILTREQKVGIYTWTGKMKAYDLIGEMTFPKCVTDLKNSMIRNTLRTIGFLRCGAKFRIQFNGNKFNIGRAVVMWMPITWKNNNDQYPWKSFANLPHAFLDASVTNSVVLEVPFSHMQSHFCLQQGASFKDDINCLGRIVVFVLNKLQPGEGASDNMTVNIYAQFTTPEVHQVMWIHDDIVFDVTNGLIAQGDESIWEKAAATGVGQALGSVLKLLTGGLATGAGNFIAGLIFDKPVDPRPAIPVLNRSVPVLCHGCGPDNSVRLCLAPISQTESDPKMLSTKFNDFNLQELLHIPQWLATTTISTSTEIDAQIFSMPVCPTYIPPDDIVKQPGSVSYRATALAYLSRAFMYWRGSLKYKFQFITSQFHSMRVAFMFNPLERVGASLNMEQRYNMNTVIFDIEEQKEFEVSVPYTSIFPWLYCNYFRTSANFDTNAKNKNPEYLFQSSIGKIGLYLNTQLIAPSNVAQEIEVNIFVSAGDDFELAVPVPLGDLCLTKPSKLSFNPTNFRTCFWNESDDCVAGNSGEFGNKQLIDYLYKLGRCFYAEGKIKYSTTAGEEKNWWRCNAMIPFGADSDVFSWVKRAGELDLYSVSSVQMQYMTGFPMFTKKWREPADPWEQYTQYSIACDPQLRLQQPNSSIAKAQGKVEEYTTNREDATRVVLSTKGASSSEAAPTTISENAMNIQTVLRRYYPMFMSAPIFNANGFTVFLIPVTPTILATSQYKVGSVFYQPNLHHIAYISRLYTYWRGSMRFKILFQQKDGTDVYAWFDPSKVLDFRMLSGFPENEVLKNMSFAGLCATSHLQGCLEIEVPYQSRYNQLLIDSTDANRSLLSTNGTLYVAIRNPIPDGPSVRKQLNVSMFVSTGDDFVLNLYRGPTMLYEPAMLQNNIEAGTAYVIYGAEAHRTTVDDWPRMAGARPLNSEKFASNWNVGIQKATTGFARSVDVDAYGAPEGDDFEAPWDEEEEEAYAQGSEGFDWSKAGQFDDGIVKFRASQIMTNLMTIQEESFEELLEECTVEIVTNKEWPQAQGIFNDLKKFKEDIFNSASNANELLKNMNEGALSQTMNNMSELVATVNDKVHNVTKSATAEAVTKYSILSAEIMTIGAFIYSLKESIMKPDLKNLIMLAITTAGTLGFAFTSALHSVIANVVGWALGSQQLPRAQALDGATSDFIDGHGKTICTVVAVIGTVFYAYLFDILPSLTTIKAAIKQIFEGEDEEEKPKKKGAKAQGIGIDLRNAHFSVMGISALDRVYTKCMEYIQRFLDWILDRENPEVIAARTSEEYRARIMHCVEELDCLDNEDYYTYAKHDPFIHNRFYRLQSELNLLTREAIQHKLDSRVCSLISECRKRGQKVIKDLERDAPKPIMRYDPFCICLAGESGTGKTKLMHKVAQWVKEEMDLPDYNLCYPKGVKDEFWSGYKNQPIVFWDEFAQSRKMDEVIPEFMTLRGSTPVMLNMAALNDKGKYFTSQCIIMTTNVPYENFNTVRDQKAFKRRRHILVHMDHKAGYNAIRLQNSAYDAFPNWEHCNFSIKSSMSNRTLRGNLDLHHIEQVVRTRVRNWHQNQLAILREADIPIEMPRGIVPIQQEIVDDVQQMVDEELEEMRRADEDQQEYERQMQDDLVVDLDHALRAPPPVENLTPPPPEDVTSESGDSNIALPPEMRPQNEEELAPVQYDEDGEVAFAFGDDKELGAHWISPLGAELYIACQERLDRWKRNCQVPIIDSEEFEECFEDCPAVLPIVQHKWTPREVKGLVMCANRIGFAAEGELEEKEDWERRAFLRNFKYTPLRYRLIAKPLYNIKTFVSELWQMAKNLFVSIKNSIFNFVENNPRLAKILGCLTLFAGVGATLYAFGGIVNKPVEGIEMEGFYDHGPNRVARLKVAPEGFYDHGPVKMARHKVNAEGNVDPVGFDIRRKVHSAVCPIGWTRTHDGRTLKMKCVRVGGTIILVPKHFFDRRKKDDEFAIYHRYKFLHFMFDPTKMYRYEDKDWVLYDLGWRVEPSPHIYKYFISEHSLGSCSSMAAILCNADDDGTLTMSDCTASGLIRFKYEDNYGDAVYCQTGWKVDTSTAPGDCGSLLCGLSKNLPPPGKILGIHVAGFPDKPKGYAVLITREQIESLLDKSQVVKMGQIPICQGVNAECDLKDLRIIPKGDFTIVGQMNPKMRVMQPPKTDLLPTPWHDEIQTIVCPKKPAHLMPFVNSAGEKISPLSIALTKYGQFNAPLPNNSIVKIKSFLKDYFVENLNSHTGKRVFTEQEAICGIEGLDFAERLNMKSSAGWPYQVEERGEKGKFHFFDENGNITHPKLKERLELRIHLGEKNERVPSLWRDCLKDELRPIEKVDAGKTRLFTIAPLDFTICVRMYFFDFVIAFYSACESHFFSAVGIDPESFAWTELYNFLREHSDLALAGDFSCFDGGLKPEVFEIAIEVINNWYDDNSANQNVRRVLFHEMLHTMQLVNDCVYMTHYGNPSGNPLTVVINTIGNLIYFLCAWLQIYPERSCQEFFQQVHTKLYGDDAIITVTHKAKKFNQNSVTEAFASLGIKFTPESKTEEKVADFRPLEEVTFLKRGFRKDEEVGNCFMLPVMSVDTLNSFLFYYRKTESEVEEQLCMNMRAAIDFAFFHGRAFYDNYNQMWKDCMRLHGFKPLSISFEEQLDKFLVKCCAAGMLTPAKAQGMDFFMNLTNAKWTRRATGMMESVLYYACAALGIGRADEIEPTDDRWAISIPSGEGKSYLAEKFPEIFVDHDELLIPAFEAAGTNLKELPWRAKNARKYDFPIEDRRILLVHSPANTNRQLIGCFITPAPTYIRSNILHRLCQRNPKIMDLKTRNVALLQIARQLEPGLFAEIT